ncbi:hypothetical protein [Arthrobacter sp. ISL-95]|uniref:hypothetical protein n=1 Tax=Arthrobacter sp. ISL-95 TaxID=2819116 RepID=UPI001BED17FC|nr:hypothetical protein [Arthrobacter sp. ISL-95]MBT2587656.1 hypothetical protein [Arthrobacter sp. ISL-95]
MILRKFFRLAASTSVVGLLVLGLIACGGPSEAERLVNDMQDAATSVPGVQAAQVHVNMNTSGNFITAKLVGASNDEAALSQALKGALPAMLEKTKDLASGTFSVSIFSPDDAVSVGSDALGYTGGTSLSDIRDYFLDQP